MKKVTLLLVAVSLFVASPGMAWAMQTFVSGEKFRKECSVILGSRYTPKDMIYEANCYSYMKGLYDFHQTLIAHELIEPQFCKSTSITLGEIARTVLNYLKEYPDKLHMTASSLVYLALSEAFPCSESEPDEFRDLFKKNSKKTKETN